MKSAFTNLAEGRGFEPRRPLTAYSLSKRAHSTTMRSFLKALTRLLFYCWPLAC